MNGSESAQSPKGKPVTTTTTTVKTTTTTTTTGVTKETPREGQASDFDFGDIVKSIRSDEYGVVRYVGTTSFSAGTWVGVEMDNATGKHDGTVRLMRA